MAHVTTYGGPHSHVSCSSGTMRQSALQFWAGRAMKMAAAGFEFVTVSFMNHCITTRVVSGTVSLMLRGDVRTKEWIFFMKMLLHHCKCTKSKRKVCLGPGTHCITRATKTKVCLWCATELQVRSKFKCTFQTKYSRRRPSMVRADDPGQFQKVRPFGGTLVLRWETTWDSIQKRSL